MDSIDLEEAFSKVGELLKNAGKVVYEQAEEYFVHTTPYEKQLKEACSNESWGCPNSTLREIARAAHDYQAYSVAMRYIYDGLSSPPAQWRRICKTLLLVETMITFGPQRIVADCQRISRKFDDYEQFSFIEDGKERGSGVRQASVRIKKLLSSGASLESARNEAAASLNKYTGFGHLPGSSSSAAHFGSASASSTFFSGTSFGSSPNDPWERTAKQSRQSSLVIAPGAAPHLQQQPSFFAGEGPFSMSVNQGATTVAPQRTFGQVHGGNYRDNRDGVFGQQGPNKLDSYFEGEVRRAQDGTRRNYDAFEDRNGIRAPQQGANMRSSSSCDSQSSSSGSTSLHGYDVMYGKFKGQAGSPRGKTIPGFENCENIWGDDKQLATESAANRNDQFACEAPWADAAKTPASKRTTDLLDVSSSADWTEKAKSTSLVDLGESADTCTSSNIIDTEVKPATAANNKQVPTSTNIQFEDLFGLEDAKVAKTSVPDPVKKLATEPTFGASNRIDTIDDGDFLFPKPEEALSHKPKSAASRDIFSDLISANDGGQSAANARFDQVQRPKVKNQSLRNEVTSADTLDTNPTSSPQLIDL